MNEGKKFEQDFKKSIPDDVYYYRLRDGTATFYGGNEKLRFQANNICDCFLFKKGGLAMLELKSHKGKSIPYTAFRENQINGLVDALGYGVAAGYLINMRDLEETYWIYADQVLEHMNTADRVSIPIDYLRTYGYLVKSKKKRTRCRYDVRELLEKINLAS